MAAGVCFSLGCWLCGDIPLCAGENVLGWGSFLARVSGLSVEDDGKEESLVRGGALSGACLLAGLFEGWKGGGTRKLRAFAFWNGLGTMFVVGFLSLGRTAMGWYGLVWYSEIDELLIPMSLFLLRRWVGVFLSWFFLVFALGVGLGVGLWLLRRGGSRCRPGRVYGLAGSWLLDHEPDIGLEPVLKRRDLPRSNVLASDCHRGKAQFCRRAMPSTI